MVQLKGKFTTSGYSEQTLFYSPWLLAIIKTAAIHCGSI
jgi:hypothetical protein